MSPSAKLQHQTWSHHCCHCENLFDSDVLDDPCPQCGNRDRRETISNDPHLDGYYGIQRNCDWPEILALHELPAWGTIDLQEIHANALRNIHDSQGYDAFVSTHFVRHPYRPGARYLRREDYEKAFKGLPISRPHGTTEQKPTWRTQRSNVAPMSHQVSKLTDFARTYPNSKSI